MPVRFSSEVQASHGERGAILAGMAICHDTSALQVTPPIRQVATTDRQIKKPLRLAETCPVGRTRYGKRDSLACDGGAYLGKGGRGVPDMAGHNDALGSQTPPPHLDGSHR